MRSDILEKLVRGIVGVTSLCALISASTVYSQGITSSKKSLEVALENAVMCKTDALNIFDGSEFDGAPDDAKQRLEALGVRIVSESRHGEGIRYQLPPGTKVFGYEASDALFFSESTTLFFVDLRSGPEHLRAINRAMGLAPVSKGNPDGYGYFNEFDVRYIRKVNEGDDAPPDTVFSGIGGRNGRDYIVIGCQNLAW